jgi:hypothetical protein
MSSSLINILFYNVSDRHDHVFNDDIVDSLRMMLFSEHLIKPCCCEYMVVTLFTTAFLISLYMTSIILCLLYPISYP